MSCTVTIAPAPTDAVRAAVEAGGGGFGRALLDLLAPFRVAATVVRRDATPPPDGAARTVGLDDLDALVAAPREKPLLAARMAENVRRQPWGLEKCGSPAWITVGHGAGY